LVQTHRSLQEFKDIRSLNKFTWIPQMFKRTSWIFVIMMKCLILWYHRENCFKLAYILNYLWHLSIFKIIKWIHNYLLWLWWVHLDVIYVLLHRGSCNMKSLPFSVKHFNLITQIYIWKLHKNHEKSSNGFGIQYDR
jgi:hypothetical protein